MKTQHINGFQQMDQVHTKIDNRSHKRDNIQQRMDDRFKMTATRQTKNTPIHTGFGEITGEQFTFDHFDRFTPYRMEKSDIEDDTYEKDEQTRKIQGHVSFSSYDDGLATFGHNQKILHNKSSIGNDINKFTLDFMINYMKYSKKQFCISPFSIYEVFATLYNGSGGETKNKLESFFGYSANLHSALKSAHERIVEDGLKIKNIIAVQDKYKVTNNDDPTTSVLKCGNNIDANRINDIIKKETNGLITNILSQDMVQDCPLLLLNILYFKSQWAKKFSVQESQRGLFNNNAQVTFMNLMDTKNQYYENQTCQILEKDYVDNWTMGFIIPKNTNFDLLNLPTLINNLKQETIDHLMIPQFEIKTKASITNLLKHMGCDIIGSNLNLSKMIKMNNGQPHDQLYIKNVIHSVVIKVDENGTKAAAATAMTMFNCIPEKKEINFIANVPFFYYIRNKTTGIISFIGEYF